MMGFGFRVSGFGFRVSAIASTHPRAIDCRTQRKTNNFADRVLCKIYMTHKEKIYFTFRGHY